MRELLAPVIVQVGLTFVLMFATAGARFGALRRREVRVQDIALGQQAWPPRATQISRSFQNQFELPPMFYAAIIVALITGTGGWPMVPLAWAFVAARLVHAYIHTSNNVVSLRFYAFLASALALLAIWVLLAARLFAAAGAPA